MLRQLKTSHHLATTLTLLSLVAAAVWLTNRAQRAWAAPPPSAAGLAVALPRPPTEVAWAEELAWNKVRAAQDGYQQVTHDGGRIELTLDPRLQPMTEAVLAAHPTPLGAAVLLDVDEGRVLAMAGRSAASRANPDRAAARADDFALALKPWAPAASVFKLVTAAALVDAGVDPEARVCYHDGIHSVEASNLTAHPRADQSCASLSYAIAKSQNAIIARLAHDHLDADALNDAARALGFGAPLPFVLPVAPSQAAVPADDESLAFARVAAGFWSTTMSPLHGAYLAATLARGGVTPPLRLVDRVVERDGGSFRPDAAPEQRVLGEDTARTVAQMMVGTTEFGTAKNGFHRNGRPLLPVAVAGKTGTLDRQQPYLGYSWFVGFAPAERPEVAVAVLLGNGEDARWRAHQVAAQLLAGYFDVPFDDAPSAPSHPRARIARHAPHKKPRRLASR